MTANYEKTGPNYITLEWASVADDDLVTLGYVVQMLDGTVWNNIYDASNNPDADTFTMLGLVTGVEYSFRVFSVNFNGYSLPSSTLNVHACGLP